jgi:threonine dehydrogenase-like Zn-dependent dehydrogenase
VGNAVTKNSPPPAGIPPRTGIGTGRVSTDYAESPNVGRYAGCNLRAGRGGKQDVDVAIEALGRQETFESALWATRPGGTLSSLGVYSGKLVAAYERSMRAWAISGS